MKAQLAQYSGDEREYQKGRLFGSWRKRTASSLKESVNGSSIVLIMLCTLLWYVLRAQLGSKPRIMNVSVGDAGVVECVCSGDDGQRALFKSQPDYDVCEIACTSHNRLAFAHSEAEIIQNGYEHMSESHVEVCVLCRDSENLLPNLKPRMRTLASKFKSMHVHVIENDSKDDTVEEFRKWGRFEKENGTSGLLVDIEHHNLMLERPPIINAGYDDPENARARATRYHRLSLLRNRCLSQLLRRKNVDYFLALDVDEDVNENSKDADGIAHSFGLRSIRDYKWDAVCANSVLKQPEGVHASLYRNFTEPVPEPALRWVYRDSLAFRDINFNLDTFRFHERRIHTPYDEPYFVQSCFGGLAIYDVGKHRNKDWHGCSYEAYLDDDCEHVSFHNCLNRLGYRMLFNPRMLVKYS